MIDPLAEAPFKAGIGLRGPHLAAVVASPPAVGFLEVHPENYMGGGPALAALERLRRERPLSLHGVGLSLGGTDGVDAGHLERLADLVDRLEPLLVSEHLSWSSIEGVYLNDLLPLPYTEEALEVMVRHIDQVQMRLGRSILVENPSSYLRYRHSTIEEPAFLAELARRTGCGLLCDINNIYVSGCNLGFDPLAYLADLPAAAIGEFHLAGHSVNEVDGQEIRIDDHGSAVAEPVWALYRVALGRFGARPTLIEWDSCLPDLPVLLGEAAKADAAGSATSKETGHVEAA
nr:hypothetical protein Hi04_10k_c5418_00027 [uncultured bacterium]